MESWVTALVEARSVYPEGFRAEKDYSPPSAGLSSRGVGKGMPNRQIS